MPQQPVNTGFLFAALNWSCSVNTMNMSVANNVEHMCMFQLCSAIWIFFVLWRCLRAWIWAERIVFIIGMVYTIQTNIHTHTRMNLSEYFVDPISMLFIFYLFFYFFLGYVSFGFRFSSLHPPPSFPHLKSILLFHSLSLMHIVYVVLLVYPLNKIIRLSRQQLTI